MARDCYIGRWQCIHFGHKWLFDQKLQRGNGLLILVRDVECDENNPFDAYEVKDMLEKLYYSEDVIVQVIPDICSVNYGRNVGYEVNELKPPEDIKRISASEIRRQIRAGSTDWKHYIDPKLWPHMEGKFGA